MNKIKLTYVGEDDFYHPTYRVNDEELYVKDVNPRYLDKATPKLYWACPKNHIEGEPDYPFKTDKEIEFVGVPPRVSPEESFNYQFLSRLKSDCDYFLGNGGHSESVLWAGDRNEQIAKMEELYNSFPDDKKPEWLTKEDLDAYKEELLGADSLSVTANNEKMLSRNIEERIKDASSKLDSQNKEEHLSERDLADKNMLFGDDLSGAGDYARDLQAGLASGHDIDGADVPGDKPSERQPQKNYIDRER